MPRDTLVFNAFSMNTVSHLYHGLWRLPTAQQAEFYKLDVWRDLVQVLERGKFDAVFLADIMGVDPAYENSWNIFAERGVQFPAHDSGVLAASLIGLTENIGLTFTSSIMQTHPFTFAKMISTFDHLSNGRVGWNVVTGVSTNASENYGAKGIVPHEERYRWADEYLNVVYSLWEGSWEEDAFRADRVNGIYADPDKIHRIDHHGERYDTAGPHLVIPSPQRTPFLYQAGASKTGRDFAARHAEGTFVLCMSPDGMRRMAKEMTAHLEAVGRTKDDLLLIQGLTFVVGSTEDEAKAKAAALDEYLDAEALVAHVSRDLGVNLGKVTADQPLDDMKVEGIQGILKFLEEGVQGRRPVVADLAKIYNQRIVGTPDQIADILTEWRDAGMGGVNVCCEVMPDTFVEFVDHVVPTLQERGLMQREYAPGTLRQRVFPGRDRYINERHPASQFRRSS